MKDEYLWDKGGEPDPEIQQLEQLLGTLRYQPRPLDIPAGLAPVHKRAFVPRFLAIAATVAIMLLGVGLWLGLQKHQTTTTAKGPNSPVTTSGGNPPVVAVNPNNGSVAPSPVPERRNSPIHRRVNREALSRELANSRRTRVNTSELTATELKEAEAGKEQLLLALRMASSKLSFAQKKVQDINSDNLIHNQHKVG